jgi:hypothetical protein
LPRRSQAADSALLRPIKVVSTSGNVTNAEALARAETATRLLKQPGANSFGQRAGPGAFKEYLDMKIRDDKVCVL